MDDYKGSLFKRDMEDYHTELNPIAGYVKQASKFLEVTFGYTPEESRKKVVLEYIQKMGRKSGQRLRHRVRLPRGLVFLSL